ncbi:MAG: hypothetical protein ACE5I3_04305 [Phycisphaerae bacterium]
MRIFKTTWGLSVLTVAGLVLAEGVNVARGQCEAYEFAVLMASDWGRNHRLGTSVSIDGDTAVAGSVPDYNEHTGWAYVYQRDYGGVGNWGEVIILSASDAAEADHFGESVCISGDTIVVGAYKHDEMFYTDCGAAYVFERDAGGPDNWGQVAKLNVSDAAAYDGFGRAVAIDGDVIVVGARNVDAVGPACGAAYVFEKPPGGWANMFETAKLTASDPAANDHFGAAVAISGETLVIGMPNDDDAGAESGSAYVFEKPEAGWVSMTETAKLTASDAAANDALGVSVAIDGDLVVVGAPQNDGAASDAGAAYIFAKPGDGWANMTETVKLTASGAAADENFGESVSLEGEMALIALRQHWSAGIGAGCVFVFDGSSWVEEGRLLPSDGEPYDSFGHSVGINGDQAVIGTPNWDYDEGGVPGRIVGAMYVFDYLSDCNSNGTLDICDVADGTLHDNDGDGTPDECECTGDLDGDGDIDLADLAQLLSNYGTTSGASYEDGDLDGDGDVDLSDLAALLSVYGTSCW